MSDGRHTRRAASFYRRLWRLYPPPFRARFEDAAIEAFEHRFLEVRARNSTTAMVHFWLRTVANVTVHGFAERFSGLVRGDWLRSARSDLFETLRTTRRNWRQHVPAVLCIGLGIGATSSVLTFVSGTLLSPLPFPDSERLVRVWRAEESVEFAGRGDLSYPNLQDITGTFASLDSLAYSGRARMMFITDESARRVEGEAIGPGYLELLGVQPLLGRSFGPDDHRPGSPSTFLLAYATWVRDYGADPSILGRRIETARGPFTVVGVLPEEFLGTIEDDIPEIEFWVPLEQYVDDRLRTQRSAGFIWVVGRLAEGVPLDRAQGEAQAVGERLVDTGQLEPTEGLWIEPFGENWRGDVRWRGLLLLGAAGLLLLVAATNVAGLMVARSVNRRRELAVRAAMGASAGRLGLYSLFEAGIVTLIGGALGVLVAPWILRSFMQMAPVDLPEYLSLAPDPRSLALAAFVITLTALVAGIAPALMSRRVAPARILGAGGRTSTRSVAGRRASRWLVIGEVTLTTVLLSTAALLVESYRTLGATEVGYRTHDVLRLGVFLDRQDVPDNELVGFYDRAKESLLEEPGVVSVGLAAPTVPPAFANEARARWGGMPEALRERGVLTHTHPVDPNFLSVLDVEILAGRGLQTGDDASGQAVAVISASFAEIMGGADATLGRRLMLDDREYEIVGVSGDVMYLGSALLRPRDLDVYVPLAREPSRVVSIAVRADGDPAALIAPVRARLSRLTPRSPLDWITTIESALDNDLQSPRFYMALLLAFAGSALLLTGAGVYAILAQKVSGERADMGVRRAFGASRARLLGSVVTSGASLCGVGLTVGLGLSLGVGWILSRSVFGVDRFEPIGALTAVVMIMLAGTLASLVPGLRATRTSPMEAMRES